MKKPDFKTSVLRGVAQAQSGQSAPSRPSLAELANKIEADSKPQQVSLPPTAKRETPPKTKPKSERKQPSVKDAFSCTKDDLKVLGRLLERSKNLGIRASKSEVLRAGILSLAETDDATFKQILMAVPQIKTGRPTKKAKAIDNDEIDDGE